MAAFTIRYAITRPACCGASIRPAHARYGSPIQSASMPVRSGLIGQLQQEGCLWAGAHSGWSTSCSAARSTFGMFPEPAWGVVIENMSD